MKKLIQALVLAVILTGCATKEIQVFTNPPTAELTATGQNVVVTKNETGPVLKVPSGGAPFELRVSADDYEDEFVPVDPAEIGSDDSITIDLPRLRLEKRLRLSSNPEGANVFLDGRLIGTTPVLKDIPFSRRSSRASWPERTLTLELEDWETETITLSKDMDTELEPVILKRLRHVKPVEITARTANDEPLEASVLVNGEFIGTTPLTVDFDFARDSSAEEWPEFAVSVGLQDQYEFVSIKQEYAGSQVHNVVLTPVSELSVQRSFPVVEMTPLGAALKWDNTSLPGALETGESLSIVRDLRRLTNIPRDDPKMGCVNSFTVTPDSQTLIFGLSATDDDGQSSNLWQSSAQMLGSGRRQITEGPFIDVHPTMGNSPGAESVVFQSNRGFRNSFDISSIRIVDNAVLGGIRQLTREERFNYSPVYTNEDWEVFFVSLEESFTRAMPQISFMGLDGTLPTYLSEHGDDLALSPDGNTVYFCREEPTSGFRQIYSIPKEGRPLTQIITSSAFMNANCFNPSISRDGNHMLFVSDIDEDRFGRKNNNIYMLNLSTGTIDPVTQNLSDDLSPVWSPAELNTLFFLSNRGGTYNIWRLVLANLN